MIMSEIIPYYDDGNVCLYNEDMKDMMGEIENGSIKLLLTDPPYGINYHSNHRKEKMKKIENDDVLFMDIDLFWDKISEYGSLWSFYSHKIELYDKCEAEELMYKRNCDMLHGIVNMVLNGVMTGDVSKNELITILDQAVKDIYQDKKSLKLMKPHVDRIKNRIIWVKNNWTAGDLEGDFGNQYECIAFMPKKKFKLRGYRYSNVWDFDRVPPSKHPTEKPIVLLSRIIESCTDVGDLVCDPFTGSGATLFACKKLNRRFVGSEIDEGHCQNIVNDNKMNQMGLGI